MQYAEALVFLSFGLETAAKTNMVMIFGEITTADAPSYESVVREAIKKIGYDSPEKVRAMVQGGLERASSCQFRIDFSRPRLAILLLS